MGKGDKKSKRGKIIQGSYGVSRAKRKKKPVFEAKLNSPAKEKKEKAVKPVPEPAIPAETMPETVVAQETTATEAAAKKKTTKTTKKTKSAEPELDLGMTAPEEPKEETTEPPAEA